ncbi:MAG: hypothetical protein CMI56_00830 [Parcubacteria group bacterium]|nr:hypothetical protein [Parcubacteria group bacterium]|tara:strand:- start:1489 stop:2160 length:672 start_codon:yes stop_codon:yes gene_type:complete
MRLRKKNVKSAEKVGPIKSITLIGPGPVASVKDLSLGRGYKLNTTGVLQSDGDEGYAAYYKITSLRKNSDGKPDAISIYSPDKTTNTFWFKGAGWLSVKVGDQLTLIGSNVYGNKESGDDGCRCRVKSVLCSGKHYDTTSKPILTTKTNGKGVDCTIKPINYKFNNSTSTAGTVIKGYGLSEIEIVNAGSGYRKNDIVTVLGGGEEGKPLVEAQFRVDSVSMN